MWKVHGFRLENDLPSGSLSTSCVTRCYALLPKAPPLGCIASVLPSADGSCVRLMRTVSARQKDMWRTYLFKIMFHIIYIFLYMHRNVIHIYIYTVLVLL